MRILLLGGTRFIGPPVLRRLVDGGHEVTVFHRGQTEGRLPEAVRHLHGDLHQLEDHRPAFAALSPEVVVHMLAMRAQDGWSFVRTFAGLAARSVVLSSQDVYRAYDRLRGKEPGPPDAVPLTESSPLRGRLFPYRDEPFPGTEDPARRREIDEYDKILVERIVLTQPELPAAVLRLPMVVGPLDPQHRTFGYLKRMDDGRPAILLDERAATWRTSRGLVENVAQAIALAATAAPARSTVYNVADADALTEAEWVAAVGRAAGWSGTVRTLPVERLPAHLRSDTDFAQHWVTDTTRIRAELGYAEVLGLDAGLAETVAWERAHPPERVDESRYDYAAEDAALAEAARPPEQPAEQPAE
jgi:nucleoside-diphosphate-sugar epimerase